jgi:hypothetical protein
MDVFRFFEPLMSKTCGSGRNNHDSESFSVDSLDEIMSNKVAR